MLLDRNSSRLQGNGLPLKTNCNSGLPNFFNPQLIGLDVLVLGREVTTESGGRIDILGLDRDGNLVIVECKRDRTPRDVIAQILDYASWVASLSTRQVYEIAQSKLGQRLDLAFEKAFPSCRSGKPEQ